MRRPRQPKSAPSRGSRWVGWQEAVPTFVAAYSFIRRWGETAVRWFDRVLVRFQPGPAWVAALALLFLAQGVYVSTLRYVCFRSDIDLSYFVSALHWRARGEVLLHTPMIGESFLSHHVSLLLLLLEGPFHVLGGYPPSLIWMQTAAVALASFPLYYVARAQSGDPRSGLLAVVLFLGCRAVVGSAFCTDFHPIVFLPLPLFAAVLGMYRNSWAWALVGLVGSLLVQEDAPLVVAAVACVFRPAGCSRRLRVTLVAAGLAGTLLMVGVQKTVFDGDHTVLTDRYGWLVGDGEPPASPGRLAQRARESHVDVLRMLGWAPVLSPAAWAASAPVVLQNSLSTNHFARKLLSHYGLSFAAILCLGIGVSWSRTQRALEWLERRLARRHGWSGRFTRWVAYTIVAFVLYTAFEDHRMGSTAPTMRRFNTEWQFPASARAPESCVRAALEFADSHPSGRWGIQSKLLPHLAHLDAVELGGGRRLSGIEHAALDTRTLRWGETEAPESGVYSTKLTAERLERAGLRVIHDMDGCFLWTRIDESQQPGGSAQ